MGDNSFKKDERAVREKVRFLIEKNLRKGLDSERIVELIRQDLPDEVYNSAKQNIVVQQVNVAQEDKERATEHELTAFWSFFKSINLKLRKLSCYNRFIFPLVNKIKANLPLVLKHRNAVSYKYFMDLGIHDFILKSYEYILERTPSYEELCIQKDNLMSCNGNRVLVLGSIRYSAEGRIRRKPIKGLYFRYKKGRFFHLISKIPLLGYFVKLIKNILTISSSLDVLRRADIEKSWAVEDIYFNLEILRNDYYKLKALTDDAVAGLESYRQRVYEENSAFKDSFNLLVKELYIVRDKFEKYKLKMSEICDAVFREHSDLHGEFSKQVGNVQSAFSCSIEKITNDMNALSVMADNIKNMLSDRLDNVVEDLESHRNDRVGSVNAVYNDLYRVRDVLFERIDTINLAINTSNDRVNSELNDIRENLNVSNDKINSEMNDIRENLNVSNDKINSEMNDIRENLNVSNDKINSEMNDIRENLNVSNDKINSEMNDIRENLNVSNDKINSEMNDIRENLNVSNDKINSELNDIKGDIRQYKEDSAAYGEVLSSHKDEIVQLYGSLSEKVDNITGDLSGKVEGVSTSHEVIVKELDAVKNYIDLCNRDKEIALAAVEENNNLFSDVYLQFENKFRGDRQMIKERLRFYLPIMENLDVQNGHNYSNIVDIGCGRGEWLELLKENRFIHMGVDMNTDMVSECHKYGLKAVQGDGIEYLKSLDSDSVYVVTAFHVVEHLEKKELVRLLKETQRVVKSGGMAIFETPNPENLIIGSCNFYTDMTHLRPIPPSLLMFLCEAVGFDRVDIVRLNPYNAIDVEKLDKTNESLMTMANFFNNASDYAILAYKK